MLEMPLAFIAPFIWSDCYKLGARRINFPASTPVGSTLSLAAFQNGCQMSFDA